MSQFNDILTGTIDEVVRNIFKDKTAKVILQYLEEGIPGKIDDEVQSFANSLPEILGSGSVIIEDLILETLHSKLGLKSKLRKEYSFTEQVGKLKKQFGER